MNSAIFVGLLVLAALCAATRGLYRHHRRRYGAGEAFTLRWTERGGVGPFRGAERAIEQRYELDEATEWSAKGGFFLGLLGFLWTPVVLVALAYGARPMVTVGLPGLVVSWSVFFVTRRMLTEGPAAARAAGWVALGEALMNVWVLVLVGLCTWSDTLHSQGERVLPAWLPRLLLVSSPSDLRQYEIPYSLERGGLIAVFYALVSLGHAWLTFRASRSLAVARRRQQPTSGEDAELVAQNV